MPRAWEYAQLYLSTDPGGDVSTRGWLGLPTEEKWQELGKVENMRALVNKLGAEGWEMVSGPTSENSVFTYKAGNETWHDRAYWVERIYWFKREVTA